MPVVLAASFSSNFWPGLLAGVVSGAITSAVAGAVLYHLQIGWEKRERKEVARRDLNHVLAGLGLHWPRDLLAYPNCTKASSTLPAHFKEAASLIVGQPFHQWRDLLPAESIVIDACTAYLQRYDMFIRTADAFDRQLEELCVWPHLRNPRDRVHAFLVADVIEDPRRGDRDRWLMFLSGAPADMDEASLRADANFVKGDARYPSVEAPFVSERAAIEEAASTLAGLLGIPR
jgi:hypothetical protein